MSPWRRVSLGLMLLQLLPCAAKGRAADPPAAQSPAETADPRRGAIEAITAGLKQIDATTDAAEKAAALQRLIAETLTLCNANFLVSEMLERAQASAAKQENPAGQVVPLRDALQASRAILSFKPVREAPLPEGFPEPTPVGEISLKQYPACRLARTAQGNQGQSFSTLFNHIQKERIAMTAPVELTFDNSKEKPREIDMAFLYRSPRQGQLGQDDRVEVLDVAERQVISAGMKGQMSTESIAATRQRLESWLTAHGDRYRAAGSLRVLGYNSPFVLPPLRYFEVEIPVEPQPAQP